MSVVPKRRVFSLLLTLCALSLAASATADTKTKLNQKADGTLPAAFGWKDFVPSEPTASKETVKEYVQPNGKAGGKVIGYKADVCDAKKQKIGNLDFEYVLWKGSRDGDKGPSDVVGSALLGGFHLTSDKVGTKFAFLQTVTETNEAPKIDDNTTLDRSYRGKTNGDSNPDWNKDPGWNYGGTEYDFFDIPAVGAKDEIETTFETALVSYTDDTVNILSDFTWSYKSDGKGGLTGQAPKQQFKVSADLLDAYGTTFIKKKYVDMTANCVPEPAFYQFGVLLTLGLLASLYPRLRSRRAGRSRRNNQIPVRLLPAATTAVFLIALTGLARTSAHAQKQRYLPDLKDPAKYVTPIVNFDKPVKSGDTQVGTIEFDYSTFINKPANVINGDLEGGAAIAGVFKYDTKSKLRLKKGMKLDWVQIVRADTAGPNEWRIKDNSGKWFPDTSTDRTSPSYTLNRPGQPNAGDAPNVGFLDTPTRFSTLKIPKQTKWDGELGLVCLDDSDPKSLKASIMGTFSYGFVIEPPTEKDGDITPGKFTPVEPKNWGEPSKTFLDTLNGSFTGKPVPGTMLDTTKWTFTYDTKGCWEAVPEASPLFCGSVLAGLSVLRCACKRRRPSV